MNFISRFWRSGVLLLTPTLFAFVFLCGTNQKIRCAYVIAIMAVFWMTEAVPLAVTALIPVFTFPLLGILSSNDVCLVYMKETNMRFLGGLMVATAIEHSCLHRRIALLVVLKLGQSPRRLMAGFMVTGMLISMWISNTATTAMMTPIVDAILQELEKTHKGSTEVTSERNGHNAALESGGVSLDDISLSSRGKDYQFSEKPDYSEKEISDSKSCSAAHANDQRDALKDMYFLSVAYAVSIGGTGTLMGTSPNLVAKGILDSTFNETDLNFASWMGFYVPVMVVCVFLCWVALQILFMGIGKCSRHISPNSDDEMRLKQLIEKKYCDLGALTFHEKTVFISFAILIGLWFFREPGFIPGWVSLFRMVAGKDLEIADSVPVMIAVFALFAIPTLPTENDHTGCLTWKVIHEKIPWGIVLLLGGGFAMAKASEESGLSEWLGEQLTVLAAFPVPVSVLVVTIITTAVTQIMSNTATASILLPVVKDLSLGICVNPLYFILPATACASYAFMLPVGTPPNAIVFAAANMKTSVMIKAGIVVVTICLLVINLAINTLGVAMFDLKNTPLWMNATGRALAC